MQILFSIIELPIFELENPLVDVSSIPGDTTSNFGTIRSNFPAYLFCLKRPDLQNGNRAVNSICCPFSLPR